MSNPPERNIFIRVHEIRRAGREFFWKFLHRPAVK
jgi:hypothetical protein